MMSTQDDSISDDQAILDEAERLIWALLDDQVEEADTLRLETLLSENEQVRRQYIECVQMHSDLRNYYDPSQRPDLTANPKSPVLGSLGDCRPDSDFLPIRERN